MAVALTYEVIKQNMLKKVVELRMPKVFVPSKQSPEDN